MQASMQAREISKSAAVRQYTLLSMLALVVVLLALLDRGLGEWSLAPVALGCVTLVLQLRFGPPLVLLSLIWLLAGTQGRGFDPIRVTPFRMQRRFPVEPEGLVFAEVALAAGMLIYMLGCYRLLGLVYHLFPVDPRLKRRQSPAGRHLEMLGRKRGAARAAGAGGGGVLVGGRGLGDLAVAGPTGTDVGLFVRGLVRP